MTEQQRTAIPENPDRAVMRRRVRERMRLEGIPIGSDDPTLLELGSGPLRPVDDDKEGETTGA